MSHSLAANLGEGHLNPTLLADHPPMLEPLVLAAEALVILDRPENLGAEESIAFGLEGPVVDGLWLLDLSKGPGTNLVRGGQANPNGIKLLILLNLLE